jgi:anti-sigma regulatory factor (Ser/Thr protein kinase)
MNDLSLHILDVAENCINADAKNIKILVAEDLKNNKLIIEINDDGKGMDEETVKEVMNPFVTSRTTRKVGLGIPFLKEAAEMAGGKIEIESKKNYGTKIKAVFQHDNIDRKPLGDLPETLIALLLLSKNTEIYFKYSKNEKMFEFDTKDLKKELGLETLGDINLLNKLKSILIQKISEIQ